MMSKPTPSVKTGTSSPAPNIVQGTVTTPLQKLYFRGRRYLAYFGGCYVFLLLLLSIPYIQRNLIFFNLVTIPLFADFNSPEKYGLAPNRTLNFKISTPDNVTIGAWFALSDPYYRSLPSIPTDPAEHVIPALKHSPAILFLHGNAATRAFSSGIQHIQSYSSRLGANVLTIDYRGFGDSSGTPSEDGLVTDAKAAFDWLISHGKKAEDILIIGHSLGTGVSGPLGARFTKEGIVCKGIVLLAPFASVTRVLKDYYIFGFIPLTKPISLIPGIPDIEWAVVNRFDTLQIVPNITAPVLIAHAEDDSDIPHTNSDILFQAFLEPVLRPVVRTTTIPKFGRLNEFDDGKRKVVLVKTLAGGHYLGTQEGLVDIIGKSFGLV